MMHSVPQSVVASIGTVIEIVNVQLYAGQVTDPHSQGYLKAVNELAVCLAPYLVCASQLKPHELREVGIKLSKIGQKAASGLMDKIPST